MSKGPSTPPTAKTVGMMTTVHSPKPKPAGRMPTAEEEKDMLRRYHDAKYAVTQHHETHFGYTDGVISSSSGQGPAEESMAANGSANANGSGDDLPPPWVPSTAFPAPDEMSEKERYRQAFEARDRVAANPNAMIYGGGSGGTPPPPVDAGLPPAFTTAGGEHMSALDEKERLRLQYAAQDAMAAANNNPPPPPAATPPPFSSPLSSPALPSELPAHLRGRSQPALPVPQGTNRPMTAAEEKAMLRAKFDAEERGIAMPVPQHANGVVAEGGSSMRPGSEPSSGTQSPSSDLNVPLTPPSFVYAHSAPAPAIAVTSPSVPAPPPLAPRPPAEYIEETKAEDAKLKRALSAHNLNQDSGVGTFGMGNGSGMGMMMNGARPADEDDTFGLKIRPTSPFALGMDDFMGGMSRKSSYGGPGHMNGVASPPPLPPKVPMRDH